MYRLKYVGYGGYNATDSTISEAISKIESAFVKGDEIHHYINRHWKFWNKRRIQSYILWENDYEGNLRYPDSYIVYRNGEDQHWPYNNLKEALLKTLDLEYDHDQGSRNSGFFSIYIPKENR